MTPMHVALLLGCLFSTSTLADTTSTFTLRNVLDAVVSMTGMMVWETQPIRALLITFPVRQ